MHNLTKIRIFKFLLRVTYPFALLFIYPFVLLKKRNKSHLFFFLDRYAIGGAQRVHLDVLEVVKDIPKQVYFTRKSPDDKLKEQFYSIPNTISKDIHFWCDNLLFRLFSVHFYAFYLNRHKQATVFSSNSTFFYDMLPFISDSIYTIELLHNFTFGKRGMEFFGLAHYRELDKRIVIDAATKENIRKQYDESGIDKKYNEVVELIEFGVDIPINTGKPDGPPLKVLYAGRGGEQKRVWLISQVAEFFILDREPVEFHFAGPVSAELSEEVKTNAIIHGEIGDKQKMNELFQDAHVIILTSSYEGFPVVIKEGMAHGCIPVVTALPGNKIHLTHMSNALLLENIEDEKALVAEAIINLKKLIADSLLRKQLSVNAFAYASRHFTKEKFNKAYRELLLKPIKPE